MKEIVSFNLPENFDSWSREQIRDFIAEVEERCKLGTPIDIPLKHYFSNGVYAREITVAPGVLIVGKIHKHQNMTVISKGEVSVYSIDGFKRVKAPATFVSSPGVKRVIFAHEETVWTTFHATPETEVEKIEKELIAEDYSQVVEHVKKPELEEACRL